MSYRAWVKCGDISPYLPLDEYLNEKDIQVHYLGYYEKWHPQGAYYYSVEHGGFQVRLKEVQEVTVNTIQ